MTDIRGVVFDAYGTLFDVYSIGHKAEQLFPVQGLRYRLCGETSRLSTLGSCHYPILHHMEAAFTNLFGR